MMTPVPAAHKGRMIPTDLLPTWWTRNPPIRDFDARDPPPDYKTARDGGVPITAAVFKRIPDDAAYIPFYLWLVTTWPGADAVYRANPIIHRRVIFESLRQFQRTNDPLPLTANLTPLLTRDPATVIEEALVFLRNQNNVVLSDDQFQRVIAVFRSPPSVLADTALQSTIQTWITEVLDPWAPADESTAVTARKRTTFQNRWTLATAAWTAAREALWIQIRERNALLSEELLAVTWDPDRPGGWMPWCCSVDERIGISQRWIDDSRRGALKM